MFAAALVNVVPRAKQNDILIGWDKNSDETKEVGAAKAQPTNAVDTTKAVRRDFDKPAAICHDLASTSEYIKTR